MADKESPCFKAAMTAASIFTRKLESDEVQDTIREIQSRVDKYTQNGVERSDAFGMARKAILQDKKELYRRTKTQLVSSLLRNEARFAKLDEAFKADKERGVIRSIKEMVDASKRFNKGEGLSLDNHMLTEEAKSLGALKSIIQNYEKETNSKIAQLAGSDLGNSILFAREQALTKRGVQLEKVRSSKPLDKHVEALGKEIYELQEDLRKTQNGYGTYRRPLRNYIHGNKWNRNKMLKYGNPNILDKMKKKDFLSMLDEPAQRNFQSPSVQKVIKEIGDKDKYRAASDANQASFPFWLADMMDKLDLDDTFPDTPTYDAEGNLSDEMTQALFSAFRNLTQPSTRQGMTSFLVVDPEEEGGKVRQMAFKKSQFMFARLSGARLLHFKSPLALEQSTNRWAGMSSFEAITADISRLGSEVGMLKWGGGALDQGFDDLLRYAQRKHGVSSAASGRLRARFNMLTGKVPQEDTVIGRTVQNLMMIQNFAKLGLVTPSSLPDSATLTTALMNFGTRNPFDLIRNHIIGSVSSYTGGVEKDYRHIMDLLGVGADHLRSEIMVSSRAGQTWEFQGAAAKMNAQFFKYNLLFHHDTQLFKTFVAQTLRSLGVHSSNKFSELPNYLHKEFARFNIGNKEWEYYRQFLTKDNSGRTYLDLEKFNSSNVKALKPALKKLYPNLRTPTQFQKQADDLYDRFTIMMHNGMRQAVLLPTSGTRYYLHGGWTGHNMASGSLMGAAFSLVSQYKNFPLQLMRNTLSGLAYGAIKNKDYAPLVNYLSSSLIYNYIAWGSKSLLTLKSWPSFSQSKYPYQSFLSEVVAPTFGLLQQAVFTEYSQGNDMFSGLLLGATGQALANTGADLTKLIRGDLSKDAAVGLASQWTPTTIPILGGLWHMVLEDMKSKVAQKRSATYLKNYSGQHYLFGN